MKRVLVLLLFLFIVHSGIAQRIQFGLTVVGNLTYSFKGNSDYSKANFTTIPKFSGGFEVPINVHLNDVWTIRSGFNYSSKVSALSFTKIDFPYIIYNGYFQRFTKVQALQIPIVLVYHYPGTRKKGFSAFMGVLFSKHYVNGVGSKSNFSIQLIGEEQVKYKFQSYANFGSYFTPEIYFGISHRIFHKTEKQPWHEFKFSFEFASNQMVEQNLKASFTSPSHHNSYEAYISPRLATLKFSYTFYPLWWAIGNR